MIGRIVSHFEIIEKIGEGGNGVVWKARDLDLPRFAALKFLSAHLRREALFLRRFGTS
jgi:serine/threonine protein kinase